jgi:putative redox protein
LEEVNVHVEHNKVHADECGECENSDAARIDRFSRVIELKGELDEKQKERLIEIANKCPVHKTLRSDIEIDTKLKPPKPDIFSAEEMIE